MRVSIQANDPGYARFADARRRGLKVVCSLDGVPQEQVRFADDAVGELSRAVLGSNGRALRDLVKPGNVLYETLRGTVTIAFVDVGGRPVDVATRLQAAAERRTRRSLKILQREMRDMGIG